MLPDCLVHGPPAKSAALLSFETYNFNQALARTFKSRESLGAGILRFGAGKHWLSTGALTTCGRQNRAMALQHRQPPGIPAHVPSRLDSRWHGYSPGVPRAQYELPTAVVRCSISPELLSAAQDRPMQATFSGDMWALGIGICVLLSGGHTPFTALELGHLGRGHSLDFQQDWLQRRLDAVLLHNSQANLCSLTGSAQDIIRALLRADPAQRLSAAAVGQHCWVRQARDPRYQHRVQENASLASNCSQLTQSLRNFRQLMQPHSQPSAHSSAGWHGGLRSSSSAVLAPASRRYQEQQQQQHQPEYIPTLHSLRSLPAGAPPSGHQHQDSQPAIRLTTRSSLPSLRHSSAAHLHPQQQQHQGSLRASHAPAASAGDAFGLSGSGSAMLTWLQKLIGRQGSQSRSGLEGQAAGASAFQDRHLSSSYI
ncbi:hypothetical protein WJX73_002266 [Symbiochloris irregularis]|uniref:Protein kinase domain-containing protein n=1 Tax=Symbiochloris irregularis TaxID=706552 RepID=A0AAW1Q0D5_9CHLO